MADKNCEYDSWLFDDTMLFPLGNYYCTASVRGKERGEFGEETDYFPCDCDDRKKCFWFNHEKKSESPIEKKVSVDIQRELFE